MLSADEDRPPKVFSARTQRLDVMQVQGPFALRSQECADLADSTTRKVSPTLCVVRGLCFHRAST